MANLRSTPARISPTEIIGQMAGEYRLRRLLGAGGFGAVYEAEHPLLKRRAAVKVLHRVAETESEAVQRFIGEAQAVNQIQSRHIVDVFSFGTLADGRHFYVMDYLEGEPLDRYLKRKGRLDVESTLQILMPIAEALDSAHAAGIIHRDLKPQNIFLALDSSGEVVPKLVDFGMAKLLASERVRTVSGIPLGTPLYMAPEQARGDKVDARSDIYALGVVCYEMLVGQAPFDAETTVAVLMAHVIQPPPRPSELFPELPRTFDEPLLAMLEKAPDARPASASEALRALGNAAEQSGISVSLAAPRVTPALRDALDLSLELQATERATELSLNDAKSHASPIGRLGLGALALVLLGALIAAPLALSPANESRDPPKPARSGGETALGAPANALTPKDESAPAHAPANPPGPLEIAPSAAVGANPAPEVAPSASAARPLAPHPVRAKAPEPQRGSVPVPPAIPRDLENPFGP